MLKAEFPFENEKKLKEIIYEKGAQVDLVLATSHESSFSSNGPSAARALYVTRWNVEKGKNVRPPKPGSES